MFWPRDERLVYNSTNFPNLSIIFPIFFQSTLYVTWTTPSLNCKHPSTCVHTPLQPYGIHVLRCVHGIKRTKTHDVIHNTFAIVV